MENLYASNKDREFHIQHLIDWNALNSVRAVAVDSETYAAPLSAVGKVAGEKIASRAQKNNEEKYLLQDGKLIWPQGIKDSYKDIKQLGLNAATVEEQYGGLGLPFFVNVVMLEMLFQADAGFATIPGLQSGVADLLETFASEELKNKYLPKMTSGEYTGAMDLTETQAGSDLGKVKTRAIAVGIERMVKISGEKIFISNGGADVHVVLARDAEVYQETLGTTKGISLYLVPKEIEGKSNGVVVKRIEEKIGLHSSPTCTVSFTEAQGFLVGQKGQGLRHMFQLMNNARLSVAAQALGMLEGAYAEAFAYAQQREQFGKKLNELSQVKDMLTEMCLHTEVIRSVLYPTAFATDMEKGLKKKLQEADELGKMSFRSESSLQKEKASLELKLQQYANRAAVLTPAIKYYAAEKTIELVRKGMQVHGGNGYMKEYAVGRYLMDSFIAAIYEGTSEVQAGLFLKDALKAQLQGTSRGNLRQVLDEVEQDLERVVGECKLAGESKCLAAQVRRGSSMVRSSLEFLGNKFMSFVQEGCSMENAADLVAVKAKDLVEMTVEVYAGYQLLLQAQKSERKKTVAEVFIVEEMLPKVLRNARRIRNLKKETLERYDEVLGR